MRWCLVLVLCFGYWYFVNPIWTLNQFSGKTVYTKILFIVTSFIVAYQFLYVFCATSSFIRYPRCYFYRQSDDNEISKLLLLLLMCCLSLFLSLRDEKLVTTSPENFYIGIYFRTPLCLSLAAPFSSCNLYVYSFVGYPDVHLIGVSLLKWAIEIELLSSVGARERKKKVKLLPF